MEQNIYGNNIIITEPSSNLRALGRNALAGKWKTAILTVLVFMLCMQVPPAILDALFGVSVSDVMYDSSGYYMSEDAYMYETPQSSPLSGIYIMLMMGPMSLGLTLFFLAMFRKQTVNITDIFLGFEKFGKALGLFLFQTLFIVLWSCLFIVPGYIAALRYSQAFYILADDPDKGIRQCMDESKAMMKGNKAKYFCLMISFIGWLILSMLPQSIMSSIALSAPIGWVGTALATIIGTIFLVPVTVYISSTMAGFYEILAGHLIKETEPLPVEEDFHFSGNVDPIEKDNDKI